MAEFSFYRELNKLTTADFYKESKKKRSSASQLYEIERVISKRVKKGEVSFCFNVAFVYRVPVIAFMFLRLYLSLSYYLSLLVT